MQSESAILEKMIEAFQIACISLQEPLSPDLRFIDIEGIDSISIIRLTLCLEQIFEVEIKPREGARLQKVGDFIEFYNRRQNKA